MTFDKWWEETGRLIGLDDELGKDDMEVAWNAARLALLDELEREIVKLESYRSTVDNDFVDVIDVLSLIAKHKEAANYASPAAADHAKEGE